jgi:hypothetical protein
MSDIEKLEDAVRRLPASEFARFRDWFYAFDADAWDRQIADDLKAGRLDDLRAEGLRDYRAGRIRDL